jgi:hypothetical protein
VWHVKSPRVVMMRVMTCKVGRGCSQGCPTCPTQGPEEDVAEGEDHATETTIAPTQVRERQSGVIPDDQEGP